ncbi:hypothetical protein MCOR34_010193 [Pyricularia oryzae]|uniref:SCP domain-containing protein n=1 Tax=Pyricularia oryzae TaxID=318829 RepID=A0A4P7NB66_PYROR|nr:hypothetical protein MCOR34_010193 [Pyricularia oryzae]KAI6446614.1 hypothetical protein MCOR17_010721 [Pyricularia oryzae]KAI6572246.1 hypothetical protein MCOR04_007692 [Pyricularia oryzae]QBZ59853.1 hypothetical protein PoMZ_04818 [Pyricularia oryzae]
MLPAILLLASIGTTSAIPQETRTVTANPASPTDEPSYTRSDDFQAAMLTTHNRFRSQHSAPDLEWNDTLADSSASHLDSVATPSRCEFAHSGGPYGENLALGYADAAAGVVAWGDERRGYDFGSGEFDDRTGHFTQMVWRDTSDVGCGRKLCGGGDDGGARWFLVCQYWPRGNIVGSFTEMVQRPREGVDMGNAAGAVGPGGWWVGLLVVAGLLL